MPIAEKTVAEVVQEASVKMSDPNYPQVMVGSLVQTHPDLARYMSAHAKELGGGTAVVNAVFHAALIAESFKRHTGRSLRKITFADLDAASDKPREEELKRRQPAIFDYVAANVEQAAMKQLLLLIAVGMDMIS